MVAFRINLLIHDLRQTKERPVNNHQQAKMALKIIIRTVTVGVHDSSRVYGSTIGCPKKNKSLNFVTQLIPVVFIG